MKIVMNVNYLGLGLPEISETTNAIFVGSENCGIVIKNCALPAQLRWAVIKEFEQIFSDMFSGDVLISVIPHPIAAVVGTNPTGEQ